MQESLYTGGRLNVRGALFYRLTAGSALFGHIGLHVTKDDADASKEHFDGTTE